MSKIKNIMRWSKHRVCDVLFMFCENRYTGYKVLSREETVDKIIRDKVSLVRYGDGEFKWMTGVEQESFQKTSAALTKRLQEIIVSDDENICIAIPDQFKDINVSCNTEYAKHYFKSEFIKHGSKWTAYLDKQRTYYNTNVSRFYIDVQDADYAKMLIDRWKKVWDNKDIIIVEGKSSRMGIGNDLFNNAKSIKRILVPSTNAFSSYDNILNAVINSEEKADLYLLAIGPTATVLGYDLAKAGYWALDVGHIDVEYEWFRRGSTKKVAIEGKAVNEAGAPVASELPPNLKKVYESQIIKTVD